jgi:hypothetical protein
VSWQTKQKKQFVKTIEGNKKMISNGITKEVSEETKVIKTTTYRTHFDDGCEFLLTVSSNGFTDVKVEWANGEVMESFSELTLNRTDLHKLASLFSFVNVEVNA